MKKKKTENEAVALSKAFADLIEKHIKKPAEIEIGEGEEKLIIKVNPISYPNARASAVLNAANLVFIESDSGVDGYMPAFLEFAYRYGVLLCYTDIEMPEALDHAWLVVNHTPIYDKVVEIVGEEEVCEFRYQVDELIYVRKEERIHMVNINKILEKLSGMVEKFASQFKDFDINETLKSLENLPKEFKNLPKEFTSGEGLGNLLGGEGLGSLLKTFLDTSGGVMGKK